LEIREAQAAFRRAYSIRDDARGVYATLAWLVEELGEVAEALLRGDPDALREEIADLLAWTFSFASLVGVDAEEALCRKYPTVLSELCGRKPGEAGEEKPQEPL